MVSEKLQLVCQYDLFGVITSLLVISAERATRGGLDRLIEEKNDDCIDAEEGSRLVGLDRLLLCFDFGKASLVGYDPSLGPHHLRTFKLFNFEELALGSNVRVSSFQSDAMYNAYGTNPSQSSSRSLGKTLARVHNQLRIDEDTEDRYFVSTCACLLVYNQYLCFVPFDGSWKQDSPAEGAKSPASEHLLEEESSAIDNQPGLNHAQADAYEYVEPTRSRVEPEELPHEPSMSMEEKNTEEASSHQQAQGTDFFLNRAVFMLL